MTDLALKKGTILRIFSWDRFSAVLPERLSSRKGPYELRIPHFQLNDAPVLATGSVRWPQTSVGGAGTVKIGAQFFSVHLSSFDSHRSQ